MKQRIRLTLHLHSLAALASNCSITFKHPSLDKEIELVLGSDIAKLELVFIPPSHTSDPLAELPGLTDSKLKDMN